MILECPECGSARKSKKWDTCNKGHRAVAMYQVLSWGRYPEPTFDDGISPPKNKGFPEEKNETLAFI